MLGEAISRSRVGSRERVDRLKEMGVLVVQSALAVALSWVFAREVVGHPAPFIAPVSAVLAVGVTLGHRSRRTVEMVIGVALGVAVADLLIATIGTGTWQMSLVVALAMFAAIVVGGGGMLMTQAAVSAVLVASVPPHPEGLDLTRAIDALVGGGAALLVGVLVPARPLVRVKRAAAQIIPELAETIEAIAAALRTRDKAMAEQVLERARALDVLTAAFQEEVQTGYETIRLSAARRGSHSVLGQYYEAAAQLDLAVRNVRVLARGVTRALDLEDQVPPSLADALLDLADAVRGLGQVLEDGTGKERAREAAVRAAGRATLVLEETGNLSVSVLVGQIRSTAVDLLRGLGLDKDDGQTAVREAAAALRAAGR
jgi:uncharacterized membrane protein YgaE (UPF0421/DUF939 family)